MEVCNRIEQKYVLSKNEYDLLYNEIKNHIEKDTYFKSTICNIYFDTESDDLIIKSIEKPPYKIKVRLRSYKVPNKNDTVFLELKSKYNKTVYKRRIELTLKDFYAYLDSGKLPNNNQVMKEVDYIFKKYDLKPRMFLAYDRSSYYNKDDKNFRITFDENLRSRCDNLKLEYGDSGKLYSKDKFYIMELKSLNAIPLWFIDILSKLNIYPKSFSKYGNIYKKLREEEIYV